VHTHAAAEALNMPPVQLTHVAADCAPREVKKVPSAHAAQLEVPLKDWYVPLALSQYIDCHNPSS
jgi:hypothetical protein